MRLFRRGEPAQPAAAAQLGTLPCSQWQCHEATGLPCTYVDRRRRRCSTAWCPEHRDVVDDRVYCRRHAGIVRALSPIQESTPLPNIDNRAPSLVDWIARDIDDDVRAALRATPFASEASELVTDPVRLVFVGGERQRAWERSWRLADHMGVAIKVTVSVEERNDTEVLIRVGQNLAARMVPPWIEQRQRGEQLSPEEDAAARRRFHESIATAVIEALAREHRVREEHGLV